MKPIILALIAAAGIGVVAVIYLPSRHPASVRQDIGEVPAIMPEMGDRLARLREIGISGNRTQISMLLVVLQYPQQGYEYYDRPTAIHALVQLHATEALELLEELIAKKGLGSIQNFARVGRARILAETGLAGIADPVRRADLTTKLFLGKLGLDVQNLNAAVHDQVLAAKRWNPVIGVELYALRELADMVYRPRDAALRDHLQKLGVAFAVDEPSALKMRLALLSKEEHIAALIEGLAAKTVLRGDDFYAVQLAIDEGQSSVKAVIKKLSDMDADREHYTHTGYSALFDILHGSGDKTLKPLLKRYLSDPDKRIVHYAKIAYRNVKDGLKNQYRAGY